MTDLELIALILAYAVLGYLTGLIRRVIGVATVYLALLAATNIAPTAANVVLQALPGWAVPDALLLGYFIVVVIVIVVVEVMASFYHSRLQLAALAFDRASGVVLGAITGVLGGTVVLFLLLGATLPGEGSPDGAQIEIHDAIRKAVLAPALLQTLGPPVAILFGPVIPAAPGAFFNGQEARLQH